MPRKLPWAHSTDDRKPKKKEDDDDLDDLPVRSSPGKKSKDEFDDQEDSDDLDSVIRPLKRGISEIVVDNVNRVTYQV